MPPKLNASSVAYQQIWARRTADEIHTLAHIKRFSELYSGDEKFRARLREKLGNLKTFADESRLDLDPEAMLPLFHPEYIKHRFTEAEAQWPLAKAWDDYTTEMEHAILSRAIGDCEKVNPRFHNWRQRQMRRTDSEFGDSGRDITHPIAAFELSEGCTVGCWFCGISADRFKGYLPYTDESASLWKGVLQEMVALFGEAAQSGFCYWATDPSDNPDYPRFLTDHHEITGMLPQTTTAMPLKDITLTREVMRLHDEHRCIINRFSILTTRIMHAVHAEFTPDELMGVGLVLQGREALTPKANAGRVIERREKLRSAGKSDMVAQVESEHGTIACVTGFLVNMVNRTVQLVSPTRASKRWPLGYRVYQEGRFQTARDFRATVDAMIDAHMPEDLVRGDVIAFRDDLTYQRLPDGFEVRSRGQRISVRGEPHTGVLGDLIHEGSKTSGEIQSAAVQAGADIFVTADRLHQLFELGLLNDDPKLGRIGSPRRPANEETVTASG